MHCLETLASGSTDKVTVYLREQFRLLLDRAFGPSRKEEKPGPSRESDGLAKGLDLDDATAVLTAHESVPVLAEKLQTATPVDPISNGDSVRRNGFPIGNLLRPTRLTLIVRFRRYPCRETIRRVRRPVGL